MKTVLKVEELAMFVLSIILFSQLDYAWWWFVALILVPDIGMFGYFIKTRLGALTYNIFYHKGLALLRYFIGIYSEMELLKGIGIILFGHASIDRIFGYGLKFDDAFKHPHLGSIGKN